MRRRAALFALTIFLFLFTSADGARAALVGSVKTVQGKVDVLKPGRGNLVPVKAGDPVDVGDIYRVKTASRAELHFLDGGIVRIGPASRVEIKDYTSDNTRTNNIIMLSMGHVQVISGEVFIRKASAFVEGNKFEVHTPNAVVGIRGSSMIVSFARGVTSSLFVEGKGYKYNPADRTGVRVNIVKGEISFVFSLTSPPTPPRKATLMERDDNIKAVIIDPRAGTPDAATPAEAAGPEAATSIAAAVMLAELSSTVSEHTYAWEYVTTLPYIPPDISDALLILSNVSTTFSGTVNASRYSLHPAGTLTLAGTLATGAASPYMVAVDPTGRFVYITDYSNDTVTPYSINQSTGTLTAGPPIATGGFPSHLTVDPTGRFLYVPNYVTDNVSMYSIDQSTGALTAIGTVAAGDAAMSIAIDPTGRFVYVSNRLSDDQYAYSINQSTGALTAIGPPVATGDGCSSNAVDPTGRFLYVTNRNSNDVSSFTINPSTGALTATGTVAAGTQPWDISIDPTGRFVYVANGASNNISVYSINQSTGALTPVATVPTATPPGVVDVDSSGRFLYATNRASNTVYTYSINQSTGALTLISTTTVSSPLNAAIDPTGRFVFIINSTPGTVSSYVIDRSAQVLSGGITGNVSSGPTSVSGATPVTLTGSYNVSSPPSFLWGQAVYSYNPQTGQNVTSDSPPNAYSGYLTGHKASDNTLKAKWATVYVRSDDSAGIYLGTLTGMATPGISMTGTINAPVQMVSSGIGFAPAGLYPSRITTTSLSNGTPLMNTGTFTAGGTIANSYYQWESQNITGQDWGVWMSLNSGAYAGGVSPNWSLGADYRNLLNGGTIVGNEFQGTFWSGSKLEGYAFGFGADAGTARTWISVGDVLGVYDPAALTFEATAAGAWIETGRFLWMAANEPAKLQALNMPCVEVGNVSLIGSANYGSGTVNVTMNNMKFFANSASGPARIWAVGQGQMGNWTGTAPPPGLAVNVGGGGLNATFTARTFDTTATGRWNATITNGTGGFNGSTTFRGGAAGTINTGTQTFSGTAAGVAR